MKNIINIVYIIVIGFGAYFGHHYYSMYKYSSTYYFETEKSYMTAILDLEHNLISFVSDSKSTGRRDLCIYKIKSLRVKYTSISMEIERSTCEYPEQYFDPEIKLSTRNGDLHFCSLWKNRCYKAVQCE